MDGYSITQNFSLVLHIWHTCASPHGVWTAPQHVAGNARAVEFQLGGLAHENPHH